MRRKGGQAGRGHCQVCGSKQQAEINAALVAGKPSLRKLAQVYKIGVMSLSAHRKNHLSPSLVAVHVDPTTTTKTAISRVEGIIARLENYIATAEKAGLSAQALASVRELRATVELLAKLSGELDERPTLTLNLSTTREWVDTRTIILTTLQDYPDALRALADRLTMLAPPANGHSAVKSTVHEEN